MKKVKLFNSDANRLEDLAKKYNTEVCSIVDALFYMIERLHGENAIERWVGYEMED